MLVGRSPDCDFVLHDEAISWRHLTLERVTEGVRVRDLGSRNGTWLDDQRVESAVAVGGSSIRAGRTTLVLASDDALMLEAAGAPERAQFGFGELVGCSAAMLSVYDRLREAAGNKLPVLLLGETGTGKELAARTIHAAGARARGPYVPLNCAAVPRDLIESELFGHARGAFTGASADRDGAFAAADGGTIFLDEIAEMPPELQPKLLRVLEDGVVQRVGGGRRRADFRVIAATNRDLAAERAARRFRDDLYFRLAVRQIRLPALADRLEDLPDLVHSFLDTAAQQTGIATAGQTRFDETAFAPLREHTWPGNVRELRNLVLAAVARKPAGVVDRAVVEKLLADAAARHEEPAPGAMTLEAMERLAIVNALRDSGGNRREAARRLGISESTLYEKIKKFGLGGPRRGGT
jgi:DNA-binding NtrC family response regulator